MRHLVIGLGNIGKRHMRLLQEAGEEVTGIDKNALPDYSNAHMVWICTPSEFHHQYAMEAIKQGKKVFIEKPIASNLEQALEIQRAGGAVWAACNYRFHPAVIALHDNLYKVGRVLYSQIWHSRFLPYQRENWREYIKNTNIVLDTGIHLVDLALWLFGQGLQVGEKRKLYIDGELYCDYASIELWHESGASTFINLDYLRRDKSWGVKIIGTAGTLTLDENGGTVTFGDKDNFDWLYVEPANISDKDKMYRNQLDYLLKENWESNLVSAMEALKICV